EGHYQPHLPADLGFYDLRLPETRLAQAEMAREYGLSGFCYYHYWFNGKRVLERPVDEILSSGKPDFPFCVCWANENWTRTWSGEEREVLLGQVYSESDDIEHIRSLIPMFQDPRYIRIDDKPLFAVYRAERLPDPSRTADLWRREAEAAGLPGIYLARVESFPDETKTPHSIGFDAAIEYQPRWWSVSAHREYRDHWWERKALKTENPAFFENTVYRYDDIVKAALNAPLPSYPYIRCVTPNWDNSARRASNAFILRDSTPESYGRWLNGILDQKSANATQRPQDPDIVFINAWNEWAEGNHLEPCQRWGNAYLQETRKAIAGHVPSGVDSSAS
ncbi:MAG TPA: glycoside hydrolase family 99-like domain-containing protein, partial [Acidobacteriaceae bacterium]